MVNDPWARAAEAHEREQRERRALAPTFKGKCGDRAGGGYPTLLSAVSTKRGRQRARNRYAGTCCYCGSRVEAGAGCIEKSGGQWVVFC